MKHFNNSIPDSFIPQEDLVGIGHGHSEWIMILSLEAEANQDGLYLIKFLYGQGDSPYTFVNMKKGEKFMNYLYGIPICYHRIDDFHNVADDFWHLYSSDESFKTYGLFVLAIKENADSSLISYIIVNIPSKYKYENKCWSDLWQDISAGIYKAEQLEFYLHKRGWGNGHILTLNQIYDCSGDYFGSVDKESLDFINNMQVVAYHGGIFLPNLNRLHWELWEKYNKNNM